MWCTEKMFSIIFYCVKQNSIQEKELSWMKDQFKAYKTKIILKIKDILLKKKFKNFGS